MADIGADKAVLFFRCGVQGGVAEPGHLFIMIIVAPFCKVVGKLEAWGVRVGVFEVNDNELFVCVRGKQEW